MSQAISVSSFVLLRNSQIILDGQILFEKPQLTDLEFISAAYDYFEINYPKFYKMDSLCKTGFIATELLLRNQKLNEKYKPEETGVVFSTSNSSLDADLRYEGSIAQTPSPSLFVYTLPNVLIGELCIRHSFKGETGCFVFDIFDAGFQTQYINSLFENERIKACIAGWADYYNGKAEAFFYLAERTEETIFEPHDTSHINQIYQAL